MSKIQELLDGGFEFIPAVVGFLVDTQNNQVLLGYREKVTSGLGQGLYSGLGGKARDEEHNKHETDAQAFIREVQEEAGVILEESDLIDCGLVRFAFLNPDKPAWSMAARIFIAYKWQGEPQMTEEGKIRPTWVPLDNIPFGNMWEDNEFWIPEALKGKQIDEVFLYEEGRVTEVLEIH